MPHFVTIALPAFLASLVEFVEALTIVLAVGVTRGWRSALLGSAAAAATLALAVVAFGPALANIPIAALQLFVGILLLFFGLRWLRKALLRYAGTIALHDESKIFARESASLGQWRSPSTNFDALGFATAYKAVALEGLEVVFIVIAVGATAGALVSATLGALAAGVLVIGAGFALRAPLARVPENTLKCVVGIMLSAFGTFWTAEGAGAHWPGSDFAILALIAGYAAAAALAYVFAKPRVRDATGARA